MHPGSIVARCNLVECIQIPEEYANRIKSEDLNCYLCGNFKSGRYAWVLADIEKIPPIATSGKQGIWYYNLDVKSK